MTTSASSYFTGGASAITVFPTSGASGHLADHAEIYQALLAFDNTFSSGSSVYNAMTSGKTGTGSLTFNTNPVFTLAGGTANFTSASINGVAIPTAGGTASITIANQGSNLTNAVSYINFTGAGVTAAGTSSVTVTIPGGGGGSSSVAIQSNGTVLTSAASVINFTGTGVTTTNSSGSVLVSIGSSTFNNPTIASATFSAGGASRAPIIINAGTLSTIPAAGAVEYDGNAFYSTTNTTASSRGVVANQLFATAPAAGQPINNTITTAQNIFPNSSSTIVLAASTTYELDAHIVVQIPATTNTGGAGGFGFAGTATFAATNGFGYSVMASSISNNSPNNGNYWGQYATSTAYLQIFNNTASSTTTVYRIAYLKGMIRTTASGTLIPQFYWNTGNTPVGTTASSLIFPPSYVKLTPVGDVNFTNTAAWHA